MMLNAKESWSKMNTNVREACACSRVFEVQKSCLKTRNSLSRVNM